MHKKTIFSSVLGVALVIAVSASAQKAYWASPNDSTVKKLLSMEKMWLDADCSPQPGLIDVFADDFQGTATNGTRYGKQEAMSTDTNNLSRQCQLGDVRFHFFGETLAVAYGNERSIRKGKDGKEFNRCLVWTDTWLKRDGKWQIIAAQDNMVECPN